MGRWGFLGLVGIVASLGGCTLDVAKAGAPCARTAQCALGLACVKGKCGKDLSSIAATNTVPMFGGSGGAQARAGSTAGAAAGAAAGESGQGGAQP